MKNVIGIISGLPDDIEIRKVRLERCLDLMSKCSNLFELPIILIAQNGTVDDIKRVKCSTEVTAKCFQKLGITKAREVLRRVFLETDNDYLICFDDDFELVENKKLCTKYLKHLNGRNWIEYKNFLMNAIALPRDIVEAEAFDLNTNAEDGTGYEDGIYVMNLKDKYRDRYRKIESYNLCKKDRHTMTLDTYSTGKNEELGDQTEISGRKIAINQIIARSKKNEKS